MSQTAQPAHASQPKSSESVDRAHIVNLLTSTPLFRNLPVSDLSDLFRAIQHHQVRAGMTFHNPVDGKEGLYFVKLGRVRLYRLTPAGRRIILTDLKAPAVFGAMAVLGQGMDGDFAEAADDSLICTVSRVEMERFLRRRPEVALELLKTIGRRLWEIERRVVEMAAPTAEQRLAAILRRLADSNGAVNGLTQEDLAEMSGTVRQTVARTLSRWRRQGLVAVRRRSVRVIHPHNLAPLATRARSRS